MCICVQRSLSSKLEVVSSYLTFSNEKLSKLFLLGNVLLRRPWGFFVFVFVYNYTMYILCRLYRQPCLKLRTQKKCQ